ncbi:hypothetical protein [Sinorhizobium alkalisoli]|uniref:hypothetical protein n=1 Tax=Sinorhizobium alkalisoli TaxID=1752398 RepID=UPI00178C222E|nr:hypothetical protein [Sinorhizobium alkalisoli]
MSVSKTIGRSVVVLAIALAPVASIALGTAELAFAKGGNGGGGNGNGGGNGKGGGNGNGGSHGKGHSTGGKQDKAGKSNRDAGDLLKSLFTRGTKTKKTIKSAKVPKTGSVATIKPKSVKSDTAGLSSLKRNYHAYLNSNDPRMAAISAYVISYAEFEAEFGPDAVPTDPALSDEALREALESFTKGGVVTDDALLEAKEILGVGPAVGKIDQIRETLPEPADTELEASE